MTDGFEAFVGHRIRKIRENQRLSLRAVADRAGLSVNAISLIERGTNSPTVSSLMRLATALEVPITTFFQEGAEETTVFTKHNQGRKSQGDGVTVESLGTGLREQQLEAFAVQVMGGSGNIEDPISHQGEEFVRCLTGEIEYCVGNEIYQMTPGDSLLFEATQPHCFRNSTDQEAVILIVFLAEEETTLARRRHLDV
jgi:transcriptional regulator with XRE-family HTH domain